MRVGTRVSPILAYIDGEPSLSALTGTVINVEGDCYLYEDVPCVITIRWDSGLLEVIELYEGGSSPDLQDVTPRLYVNAYLMTREYGGPEEGGWTFQQMTPLPELCKVAQCSEEADRMFDELTQSFELINATRPPLNSVLSNGIYVVQREAFPAAVSPAYKPVYQ